MREQADAAFKEFTMSNYQFRMIDSCHLELLYDLIHRQSATRLDYFRPHNFERNDLEKVNRNSAFMMFGVFHQDYLVGYFFLRCFWNRKCFVGRLIDEPFEKQGIGRMMNQIMYQTAWRSGFRVFTTVSQDNEQVMRSHANNPTARIVKPLANRYLLVEFIKDDENRHEPYQTVKEFLESNS